MTSVSNNPHKLREAIMREKQFVEKRERALKKLNKDYHQKEQSIIDSSDERMANLRTDLKTKEVAEINKHDEALKEIREHNKNVKIKLEQERAGLIAHETDQIKNIRDSYKDLFNSEKMKNFDQYQELTAQTDRDIEKLERELSHHKQMAIADTKSEMRTVDIRNDSAIKNQQGAFSRIHQRNQELQADTLARQEIDFQKTMQTQQTEFLRRKNLDSNRFQKELTSQQKFYQQKMAQEKNNFEEKYKQLISNHKQTIDNLQNLSQRYIQSIKNSTAESKNNIDVKANDEFYNSDILEPKLQDLGSHYQLDIEVPKHEKDRVILYGDGRQIRLTLTRSMEEEVTDALGNVNKTKRSELLTKKIPTQDIIDTSKIKESYEDGILSFKIAKK